MTITSVLAITHFNWQKCQPILKNIQLKIQIVKRCRKIITFSFKKFLIKIETLQFSNFYVRPAAKKERKLIESYKKIRLSLVDGKKKRRQKLIGKQNPKKKKKKQNLTIFSLITLTKKILSWYLTIVLSRISQLMRTARLSNS